MTATVPAPSTLRVDDGRVLHLDVGRWVSDADAVDRALLDRALAPVLDVGCGPGRLVQALHERGTAALGVDVSAAAVAMARRRGASVIRRSIFEHVPRRGTWRSALLIDGSVGIGGNPHALLRRVHELLGTGGRLLVEVEPPHEPTESLVVRLERGGRAGPWFPWARVSVAGLPRLAESAGFGLGEVWEDDGRHFARLDRQTTTTRVTHFVCSTPGRSGAISRTG